MTEIDKRLGEFGRAVSDVLPGAADYEAGAKRLAGAIGDAAPVQPAGPWIMTASGRAMEYLSPDPAAIALTDIAAHLAKLCRFAGAVRSFYSVAQHSVFVSDQMPMDSGDGQPPGMLKLAALLHDGHEFIIGDLPTPMKWAIRDVSIGQAGNLVGMARKLDAAIYTAFGIPCPLPAGWAERIKLADMIALATERRDLMPSAAPGHPDWDIDLPDAAPNRIRPLPWDRAEELFLDRARYLAACTWADGGAWDK